MYKYFSTSFFIVLSFCVCLSQEADHIIFTQITITPDEAEVIAIHNPTEGSLNLSDYYLSDAESGDANINYYNLPTGNNYWSGFSSDFIARFPDIDINPGQTITISIKDVSTFNSYYSYSPDLTLTDDMLDAVDGQVTIGSSANLADNYESLILFYWDGSSSIVQDVDYFYWGDSQGLDFYGIDKTDVLTYENDTPFNIQADHILEAHNSDYSYVRKSTTENGESGPSNNITGNGITEHDETSEIFNQSWEIILNPALPEPIIGCTDDIACNYDENAEEDDGSCEYSCHNWGCLDSNYDNYDSEATMDQGSCLNFTDTTIEDIVTDFSIGSCNTIGDEVKVSGKIIEYAQITSTFWILSIIDDNGFMIEVLPGEGSESWQINESYLDYLVDPYNYTEYVVSVHGVVGEYPDTGTCDGKAQIITIGQESSIDDFIRYHTQGEFIENDQVLSAEIVVAPYVLIPSIGERINFMYSFPSESRVVIRIFSLDGRFITSLVDRYYDTGGTVLRARDFSSWDGRDHLGQIVNPGTYLIHIEASNFKTAETSSDISPIVVGVAH